MGIVRALQTLRIKARPPPGAASNTVNMNHKVLNSDWPVHGAICPTRNKNQFTVIGNSVVTQPNPTQPSSVKSDGAAYKFSNGGWDSTPKNRKHSVLLNPKAY